MGKVISFLIAFISVAGLAVCFDAIVTHCVQGIYLENKFLYILTGIGRFAFGWFVLGYILFPIIYKYFRGDDK